MRTIVGKLATLVLISVGSSVAATPAFADWDKLNIPFKEQFLSRWSRLSGNISLVDAIP